MEIFVLKSLWDHQFRKLVSSCFSTGTSLSNVHYRTHCTLEILSITMHMTSRCLHIKPVRARLSLKWNCPTWDLTAQLITWFLVLNYDKIHSKILARLQCCRAILQRMHTTMRRMCLLRCMRTMEDSSLRSVIHNCRTSRVLSCSIFKLALSSPV